MHSKMKLLAPAVILFAAVASCSTASPPVDHDQTHATADEDYAASVSLVQSIASMSELEKLSSVAVVATAGAAHTEEIAGIPFTVTDVSVIKGTVAPGTTLAVRQTGSTTFPVEGVTQLLKKDSIYILYLSPFEREAGETSGQYVITAEQGSWVGRGRQYTRDFASEALPNSLPQDTKLVAKS